MVKRSREDFEPSSPDSPTNSDSDTTDTVSLRIVIPSLRSPSIKPAKFLQLDPESSSGERNPPTRTSTTTEMRCSLPPHRQTLSFHTFEDYEVHYAKEHTHRCLECKKNFPTGHFLNLHIEENHDSLVDVRRERGEKTYACFVEDCDRVCSTPRKRRMHMIDKHLFPKEYDFYVVNDGIDRRSSMLRSGRHRRGSSAALQAEKARRRASTLENGIVIEKSNESISGDGSGEEQAELRADFQTQADDDINDLVGGMSALKFVPPSVRFGRGRGKGRGGFCRA